MAHPLVACEEVRDGCMKRLGLWPSCPKMVSLALLVPTGMRFMSDVEYVARGR